MNSATKSACAPSATDTEAAPKQWLYSKSPSELGFLPDEPGGELETGGLEGSRLAIKLSVQRGKPAGAAESQSPRIRLSPNHSAPYRSPLRPLPARLAGAQVLDATTGETTLKTHEPPEDTGGTRRIRSQKIAGEFRER